LPFHIGNHKKAHARAIEPSKFLFNITGGEVHDGKEASKLIAELPKADYIIADRGYDSEDLRTA
jgi:IS5 family transposase